MNKYAVGIAKRRAIWARSRTLPQHCPRLLMLHTLPSRVRETSLARRLVGGLSWRDCGETTELTFPTGDCIHLASGSPTAFLQGVRLYIMVSYLGQYFLRHQPQAGDMVVDVGGNLGCFALAAAKLVGPTGHVYSCEPVPDNLLALKRTVEANKLTNVSVQPVAVGAQAGELELHLSKNAPAHSAVFDFGGPSVVVKMTSLDELVSECGLKHCDFLKIDVEGYESEVLRGGRRTLTVLRPYVAMAGYHQPGDLQALPNLLRQIEPAYVCDWDTPPAWSECDIFCHVPDVGTDVVEAQPVID